MRVVIQRVTQASVSVDNKIVAEIKHGLVILVGIETEDSSEDSEWLCNKITKLRLFDDTNGIMNHSVTEADGNILVVSQFTLFASTKKGNRPSYIRAARPEHALPLYEQFIWLLGKKTNKKIQTGIFGAMMHISIINDGPVTLLIDSKNRE